MKQLIALICISICFAVVVIAKDAQPNEDPQIEQRMKNLTEQLRCLVCQNETLADSRADLAEDLRKQIREQMKAISCFIALIVLRAAESCCSKLHR